MTYRQIVMDTETTGMPVEEGHKLVEIGAVELIDRKITKSTFHKYINPEREVDAGALAVHGLDNRFLEQHPVFAQIADDFIDYIRGAELIIHNADFDLSFLNAELTALGKPPVEQIAAGVIDSLKIARDKHPGQRNSLDALCRRYHIDNSERTLHGALLDSEILADVYLALTGGQWDLSLDQNVDSEGENSSSFTRLTAERQALKVIQPNEQERQAHQQYIETLRKNHPDYQWLR
ncbi:MAG TPA: DNA polymerase III subunit epsilon [Halothiobacillaceae bacterium]|nr:DNA polymerase III subunit epsilon [Halothiobacillaceae bacterium]